jgi:Protein of unknown function (DUF1559)
MSIPLLQCPSDATGGVQDSTGRGRPVDLIGLTSYAGSIGSQIMQSGAGCNLSLYVGNGGAQYDPDDDGEDWFGYTSLGVPCNFAGPGNIRSDCPYPDRISGVFARSTWAAKIAQIKDGTSNTIAMGEVRGWCSGHLWRSSWTKSEGLWFATTAPINFPTCPGEDGQPLDLAKAGSGCNDKEGSWNTNMGFKSVHPNGCLFMMADGSAHFLSESIDHTTYQALGDRQDGTAVGQIGGN